MTYRYFYKELQWKFRSTDGSWIVKDPPLPEYVKEFSPVHFVKIWAKCHSMNDVHRVLFWLNREEIDNYVEEINISLQDCGYELLKPLQYRRQGIFSDEDFLYLEDKGYIKKKDTKPDSFESLVTTGQDMEEEHLGGGIIKRRRTEDSRRRTSRRSKFYDSSL